ncbi:Dynamin-1-like protein [Orchesella cincta]|uniref:Dynamin-1-like protein n=1 Tax=Orchesella cincta TaxID=48709 RepID=A0A1D2MAB8_ORCCI|nr:Dynamin-1-like protein [Orchesella cincta]
MHYSVGDTAPCNEEGINGFPMNLDPRERRRPIMNNPPKATSQPPKMPGLIENHELGTVMRKLNPLYDVYNKLNADGYRLDFNLPRIVVEGTQSHGKTSVLESVCGEDLLPKGDNIQTRCPIELQLRRSNEKWAEVSNDEGKRHTDMNVVRQLIQEHNAKIIESGKVISDDVLTVKLFSPHVVDLTLVDLPGLIEVAVKGMPEDLPSKISALVEKFISEPNSIILAVASATENVEGAKSVRMALNVDPLKKRTMLVLTKLDLSQDVNAYEALKGEKLSYDLGVIGVVNRSDSDIKENKSIQELREKEKDVLLKKFPLVAARNGVPYLIARVCDHLFRKVSDTLPDVKACIDQRIRKCEEHIISIGPEEDAECRRTKFIKYLNKFIDDYRGQINGKRRRPRPGQYPVHAFINSIFSHDFSLHLKKKEWTNQEISQILATTQAMHYDMHSIDTTDAFQAFASQKMQELKPLLLDCAKQVYDKMLKAIRTSFDPEADKRYPNLNSNIALCVTELCTEKFESLEEYLEKYIDSESDFSKFYDAEHDSDLDDAVAEDSQDGDDDDDEGDDNESGPSNVNEPAKKATEKVVDVPKDNFEDYWETVRSRVDKYFKKAKKGVKRHVPKAITSQLMYGVEQDLADVLFERLHRGHDKVDDLMRESESLLRERASTQETLEIYQDLKSIVDDSMESTTMKG